MDEELLNALLKRAKGYSYNEVQEEYAVNDDGQIALTKRKVMEKYCPPDSSALKTYLDLCADDSVQNMTDEQLLEEKHRLLQQLYKEEKDKQAHNLQQNILNAKDCVNGVVEKCKNQTKQES